MNDRLWQILLQKSFWGDERKVFAALARAAHGDVKDRIVSQKNHHGPAYRRHGALHLKINFREIFGIVRISTFATKNRHLTDASALLCPLMGAKQTSRS
jgi:hypothetical protein